MMVSRRLRVWGAAIALGLLAGSSPRSVHAGEPYVGVDLGVAAPTEKFRDTADVGGVIAGHAGYRLFTLADSFALSIEGIPQFAAFPIQSGVSTKNRDIESLFSFTAGPKLSLMDDIIEAYFSAGGGYYTHTTGVVDDDGGGWFIAGGLNYQLGNGNLLGLFARRDQADMRPVKGPSTDDTTYFTGGLSFTHLFLQEEPVAPVPPPPPAPPAAAAPAPVKKKIVLRGVNFDFDKASIRADAKPILDEAIATLKETVEVNVEVEGHTDSVGSEAYNQKLSERRARAVADYLSAGGINRSRINTVGFGESRPVTSNDTAAGRAENRRVELRVSEE
jgi:outer membrane protein OmpA-like peptidoglycan-associated protein